MKAVKVLMDRMGQWHFRRASLFLLSDQLPVLLVLMHKHHLSSHTEVRKLC